MAKNAGTTNTKTTDSLVLTDKPVLVQNNLGIFYGFLEKSDTRNGTALLSDGFMLSPDHHITFSQYLDFFSAEIMDRVADLNYDIDDSLDEDGQGTERTAELESESIIPNEILLNQDVFNEHKRNLTITDYASEGIFLVQHRTSTHEYSKYLQASAPMVSLTNVIAIAAISEQTIPHTGFNEARDDLENSWVQQKVDSIDYMDALTPMITFGLLSNDLPILIYLGLHKKGQKLNQVKLNRYVQEIPTLDTEDPHVTQSFQYMIDSVSDQVRIYENIADDKNVEIEKDMVPFLQALANLPSLVVNSEKRVKRYKDLKKAQLNEQNK